MERNYLFDNMKVLLIFSVVLAHFVRVSGFFQTNSPAGVIYITAFSFIMQGFLFISGFFSKNTDKCRKGSIKNFLLPYFVLMAAMFAVRHIIFGTAELDFARPSHALWFLLVMFVYRFCIKDLQRIPGVLFVSLILMLGSGCFPIFGERLAAGRLLAFLFFFMLGFRLEWRHIEKIRRIPKRYIVFLLSALIAFSWIAAYKSGMSVELWHMKDAYSDNGIDNITGIIVRALLCVVSLGWLIVMINLIPNKKLCFSGIGKNTIMVYILHIPVRYMIKDVEIPFDGGFLSYLTVVALSAAVVYIFSRPSVRSLYELTMNVIYDGVTGRIFTGNAVNMPGKVYDKLRMVIKRR